MQSSAPTLKPALGQPAYFTQICFLWNILVFISVAVKSNQAHRLSELHGSGVSRVTRFSP